MSPDLRGKLTVPFLTGLHKYMQIVKACWVLGVLHLFQLWRVSSLGLQIPFPLNNPLQFPLLIAFFSQPLLSDLYPRLPVSCPCLPSWKQTKNKQTIDSFYLCLSNTNLTAFICVFETQIWLLLFVSLSYFWAISLFWQAEKQWMCICKWYKQLCMQALRKVSVTEIWTSRPKSGAQFGSSQWAGLNQ